MDNNIKAKQRGRARSGRYLVADLKHATAGHKGWYGYKPLAAASRYWPISAPSSDWTFADQDNRGASFVAPTASSSEDDIDRLIQLSPLAAIRETLAKPPRPDRAYEARAPLRFAIVTAHVSNLSLFEICAKSIAELIADETSRAFRDEFRWVVRLETSSYSRADLESLIPPSIRPAVRWIETRICGDDEVDSVSPWQEVEGYWLILLSDLDRIASFALDIARHYVGAFPDCRFLVPAVGFMDDGPTGFNAVGHGSGGHCVFEQRWPNRRVILIRQDLFLELAPEKIDIPAADGFGLALKASLREPLLYLPEVLSFRHPNALIPSVVNNLQRRTEMSVRRAFLRELARVRWPQPASSPARRTPRPSVTTALCIVRTRGSHLDLLREAVASILHQTTAVTACVVVHGSQALYDEILRWLGVRARLVVLHAWAPDRNRGYPANVGLDFLIENADIYSCFSFLDDDDIFYPLFFERLMWALNRSQADIAYAQSTQRRLGAPAFTAHSGRPMSFIVAGNFIPIHCYLARTDFLLDKPLRFREDVHYLEDWDFLLQTLRYGAEFNYLPEVLCEYRLIGDGNVDQKRDPELYRLCRDLVQATAEDVARRRGCGGYLRDLANFDVSALIGFAAGDIKHAADAWAMVSAVESEDNG